MYTLDREKKNLKKLEQYPMYTQRDISIRRMYITNDINNI